MWRNVRSDLWPIQSDLERWKLLFRAVLRRFRRGFLRVATGEFLGAKTCMNEQIENKTKIPASICLKTKIYGRLKTLQKVIISGNTTRQIAFKIELHFGE